MWCLYSGAVIPVQVCARCIFRLFSLHEQICSHPSIATPVLSAILYEIAECDGVNSTSTETKDLNDSESVENFKEEIRVCSVCLGIMQYLCNDDKGMLVKKECASDFAASIDDVVRQEGHQVDSFSLEVSLPQIVVENEKSIWLVITMWLSEFIFIMNYNAGWKTLLLFLFLQWCVLYQ